MVDHHEKPPFGRNIYLFISSNHQTFANLFEELHLENNKLRSLPESFGDLTELRTLSLERNLHLESDGGREISCGKVYVVEGVYPSTFVKSWDLVEIQQKIIKILFASQDGMMNGWYLFWSTWVLNLVLLLDFHHNISVHILTIHESLVTNLAKQTNSPERLTHISSNHTVDG